MNWFDFTIDEWYGLPSWSSLGEPGGLYWYGFTLEDWYGWRLSDWYGETNVRYWADYRPTCGGEVLLAGAIAQTLDFSASPSGGLAAGGHFFVYGNPILAATVLCQPRLSAAITARPKLEATITARPKLAAAVIQPAPAAFTFPDFA